MNRTLAAIMGLVTIAAFDTNAAPLAREVNWLAEGAQARKTIIVPEATGPVVVDGKLDDAAWSGAMVIDQLLSPNSGQPEPHPAKVKLLYDRQNLYVGMAFHGDDMSKLELAPQKEPDVWAGHMAEMFLDPTGRGKGRYQFALNAVGTRYDGQSDGGPAWQGQWQGKGSVHADHWEIEIAIPYTEFGLKAPSARPWLANFARGGDAGFRASWTGAWDAPETMGQIFFGADAAAAYRAQLRPALALILDREEYDPLDNTGVALAKLDEQAPAGAQLVIEVMDAAGKSVRRQELGEPNELMADITLDLREIPLGEYTVRATLRGKDGTELATAEAPLRKKVRRTQVSVATRQRVPITVWPSESSERWPITTGVPFPQGALYDASRTRVVDEAGKEIPCQTFVRSLWTRHGSVRWLGLDFQAALAPNGTKYFLEFGTKVKRAKVKQAIKLTDGANQISVDTGAISFIVRKRGFNLLDNVRLNGKEISRQGTGDGLQLTDHEGAVYRAANDSEASVTVEEAGPLRVTIRAEGWYVKDGTKGENLSPFLPTDKLCKHVTRITAWQGKPFVGVKHDLIVTFDTHKVRLRNIAISQRVAGAARGEFGLDGASVTAPEAAKSIRLYQPASDDAQVETGEGEAITVVKTGQRADGWVRIAGPKGAATLCLTDPWQLFPKELEVSEGALWLHVWPKHGRTYSKVDPNANSEIYKAWWCHTGAELNFQMPEETYQALLKSPLAEIPHGRPFIPNGRISNAQGVAIENNFLLAFDGAAPATTPQTLNALWQLSPHAWADPAWVCDSRVFGWITPRDEARFGDVERMFDYSIFVRVAAQEYAKDYGQFNWFDAHSDGSSFRDGKWSFYRVWNAGHHGEARAPWYLYARSGDPRHLQIARRWTRHVMNVDVTHYVTPNYELFSGFERPNWGGLDHTRGAMFHVKGFTHWGGDSALVGHYINFDHMLWDYYVTGNRRGLDVVEEWAQGVKDLNPRGSRGREATQPIAELTELYQATFDPRILDILHAYVQRILNDGPFANQHVLGYAPFLERYLPFSGNRQMRERAVEWGLAHAGFPQGNQAATLYYETGDTEPLRKMIPRVYFGGLRNHPGPIVISPQMSVGAWYEPMYFISYTQPYLRALVDAGILLTVTSMERQRFPVNAVALLKKQADEEVTLAFNYAGVRPIPVTLTAPDGKTLLSAELPAREKGKEESLVEALRHPELPHLMPDDPPVNLSVPKEGAAGIYKLAVATPEQPLDRTTPVVFPVATRPMVCVVSPGQQTGLYGHQLWYFRTAPDQTVVELNVRTLSMDGGVQLQVTTGDGAKVLGRYGLISQPGTIKVNVEPGQMYRLVCTGFAHHPMEVTPVKYPLVLARTAEEWFAPPSPANE